MRSLSHFFSVHDWLPIGGAHYRCAVAFLVDGLEWGLMRLIDAFLAFAVADPRRSHFIAIPLVKRVDKVVIGSRPFQMIRAFLRARCAVTVMQVRVAAFHRGRAYLDVDFIPCVCIFLRHCFANVIFPLAVKVTIRRFRGHSGFFSIALVFGHRRNAPTP